MTEEFTALVRQSGPVVVVTIPAFLIKNDRLTVGKEYSFTVDEAKQDAEQ